ncbi:serine hydrolase [bacterium]|nr:serine hydrolase [bacterium]
MLAFVMILAGAQASQSSSANALPSDAEIRNILNERVRAISAQEDGIGIVVGVIEPQGRRVISHGHLKDSRPLDGNTVFEIGSVTKVFTGLLLADMVNKREVDFADQVAKYLPASVRIPSLNRRSITFLDLATHTSALPFMPEQSGKADYSAADLYQFLAAYKLRYDIGTKWEYSNIGYWLLSETLTSRAGRDYESLLRERVITPLKLANTDFILSPKMKEHLPGGHDAASQPAPPMSTIPVYSVMPAAGALFSTVNDLLTLLSVAIGYEHSPLAKAVALSVSTSRPVSKSGDEQALGWTVIGKGNDQLIFRDGGTFGYSSCVMWDPVKRVGVAVLSNHAASVADIARHILRPDFPLEHPKPVPKEISLESSILNAYVGRYDAAGEGVFAIIREGDALMLESPESWGLPRLRIRPESEMNFFASELPLRITFQRGSDGSVIGILIYPPRGQKAVPAKRISSK